MSSSSSSRATRFYAAVAALATAFTVFGPQVGGGVASASAMQQDAPISGAEIKCVNGKAKGFDCQNVDLLSFLPASAIGGKEPLGLGELQVLINDMWGWTDPASGREFAIVGRVDGSAFIEVTDPLNPKYLGELPLHDGANPGFWRDMKVYKNHAFIVADGSGDHGMQVFDLTQLLNVKNAPAVFTETAHYNRVGSIHNIVIDTASGFVFLTAGGEDCGNRGQIIDVRDPKHPTFAGCVPTGGHDAQCLTYNGPDKRYMGREICIYATGGDVSIIDVTDKKDPKVISTASYPSVGYAHQGWFSDDQRYFYLDDEADEEGSGNTTRTIVFDFKDLTDPVVAKEFFGTTHAIDHNLYVRGKYVYEANYKAGLRILDISNPTDPKEIAYFDTTPDGENDAAYGGAWSDYPFFKNGVVGVSSISEGFFLVRFKPSASAP